MTAFVSEDSAIDTNGTRRENPGAQENSDTDGLGKGGSTIGDLANSSSNSRYQTNVSPRPRNSTLPLLAKESALIDSLRDHKEAIAADLKAIEIAPRMVSPTSVDNHQKKFRYAAGQKRKVLDDVEDLMAKKARMDSYLTIMYAQINEAVALYDQRVKEEMLDAVGGEEEEEVYAAVGGKEVMRAAVEEENEIDNAESEEE
ncbi:hypothetical protein CkaCkLH20_13035 [Colletotrichum karsti]|uniref:Uncharacterized protein n=1 Tax=Colletotrichum karsti TaxID=1095194 RepID=A0A9P6HTP0_9PEZI|nr:uncharacterized protein CkaCkLH20_13035 [Colletotrichum karsti]KAF9869497.1 hypothetical protein CkaCkLH20_13035 [Colletotrichum karsti]